LEGLEFVFVELPKFIATTYEEKKMKVLWLRFLTEIKDGTSTISDELMENIEIKEALDILEESSFSLGELETYDSYWDWIRTERTYFAGAERKGMAAGLEKGLAEGRVEGMEKGMEKGLEKGKAEAILEIARALKQNGVATALIIQSTGLSEIEIESL
jgi:predicted transposase/invertase (TIGR01784 family)